MSTLTEQLREALAKSTSGEWININEDERPIWSGISRGGLAARNADYYEDLWDGSDGVIAPNEDRDFIVLAHNTLPKLLDEYEKLEREVERLKEFEWKYNDLCK